MTSLTLSLLLGLTTFFSATVSKAETAETPNEETTNAQAAENDGNLDHYFNRTDSDTNDSNQPLSAQATTEETAPAADAMAPAATEEAAPAATTTTTTTTEETKTAPAAE